MWDKCTMGTQNILKGWTNISTVPNTAKPQSLRMEHEHEDLSYPKEPGRKKAQVKKWGRLWTQFKESKWKKTFRKSFEMYFDWDDERQNSVYALSRVKTTKLSHWYRETVLNSVIARVRNGGSHFGSQTATAFAGSLDFVRNSERPPERIIRKARVNCKPILIY